MRARQKLFIIVSCCEPINSCNCWLVLQTIKTADNKKKALQPWKKLARQIFWGCGYTINNKGAREVKLRFEEWVHFRALTSATRVLWKQLRQSQCSAATLPLKMELAGAEFWKWGPATKIMNRHFKALLSRMVQKITGCLVTAAWCHECMTTSIIIWPTRLPPTPSTV